MIIQKETEFKKKQERFIHAMDRIVGLTQNEINVIQSNKDNDKLDKAIHKLALNSSKKSVLSLFYLSKLEFFFIEQGITLEHVLSEGHLQADLQAQKNGKIDCLIEVFVRLLIRKFGITKEELRYRKVKRDTKLLEKAIGQIISASSIEDIFSFVFDQSNNNSFID